MMILNALNTFANSKYKGFQISFHHERELFRTDIIRALIEEEVLHAEKHLGFIKFGQPIYLHYAKEYIEDTKSKFSRLNKYFYRRYRFYNFIRFGTRIDGRGANYRSPIIGAAENKTYRYEFSKLYWKE